jgi:beta-glucosidase
MVLALGSLPFDIYRMAGFTTMMRAMRALIAMVAFLVVGVPLIAQGPGTPPDSQAFLDQNGRVAPVNVDAAKIRALLGKMTLKEKVGQMTQLEIGMITDGDGEAIRINPDKLHKAIAEYGVGSILNVKDQALPLPKWREIVTAIQDEARKTRLRIPVVYGIDTIHGANYVRGGELFPQPLGMASTWNPELMMQGSHMAAIETRAAGLPWNFSPVLDVGRQPLWPRLWETFGEDVHLVTVMGVAAVRGYQGADPAAADRVGATLKHYVGYSAPVTGHDRTPALIPDVLLRETYLPPFAAAVRAGALSVMVNSGEVNGIPGHVNGHLLKTVLRGEMGFDGVVVSDWADIKKLVDTHHTSANERDATRDAVLAGIDMSMVPSDYGFPDLLLALAESGAVPRARIDEAVTRILTMKARLGLFDDPLRGTTAAVEAGSPEARRLALAAARESIVLLKNAAGVLPLASSARVLLTGPTADSLLALNNGWSLVWQGNRKDLYPSGRPTVRGALDKALGGRVTYVPGADYDTEIDVAAARAAAAQADVVVLCLGELAYAETPGNIDDLELPAAQIRLAREVAAAGKPVILLLLEGRPRLIRKVADAAQAIVLGLNPGIEGGQAIADVLVGTVNPSGKLPITYPRDPNALVPYDHKAFDEQDKSFHPQFEFGHGLSYTTFAYSGLSVSPTGGALAVATDVSVTVANTGAIAGAEVVQLYVSQKSASVTPPVKRLKRFVKVPLAAGERRALTFHLTRDDFSFIGRDGTRIAEPGSFTVMVGPLRQDIARK